MRVHDVLSINGAVEKSQIVIEGFFVMRNGVGYFAENFAEIEELGRAVFVDAPNLENILLSSVPAYGGGKYSYCDRASVSGWVNWQATGEFPCSIGNISDFIIYKHGEAINVSIE